MKKIVLVVLALLAFTSPIFASTCFWVPIVVTGAVSGTGGVCRLTITAITGSGLVAGDSVIVASVGGATGCNVTTTISTVVSSTQIELFGTTFGGAYTSGGTVAGGHWTTTNTAMWASGTGGTVGTCGATGGVPKQSADTATLDASSGSSTVIVDSSMNGTTLTSITATAFTGTLDFSVNNPSMTISNSFSFGGAASNENINLGSGTFTLTGLGATVLNATATNLTLTAGSSTILASANTTSGRTLNLAGKTWGTISIAGSSPAGGGPGTTLTGSGTVIGTLSLSPPLIVQFNNSMTITNALNIQGTGYNNLVQVTQNGGGQPTLTLSSSGNVCNWCVWGLKTATNTLSATNSFPNGSTSTITGVTFTAPGGGAPPMIGGI